MYTEEHLGLGQAPPAPAAPSLWESFANIISGGVSAGFNIYNRVAQIKSQKEQTKQAQQMAAMYAYGVNPQLSPYGSTPLNPTMMRYPQPSMSDGWTIPLLIAGAATIGFVVLKRK